MRAGSPDHEWREDCAPRRVLEIFSSKWTSMILHVLDTRLDGCARTGVLQRSLPGISKKMLTQTLRELERNGLIERTAVAARRAHVEYRLTAVAGSLVETLVALDRWAERHFPELDAARERYDASVQNMR